MSATTHLSEEWSEHERRRFDCAVAIATHLVNVTFGPDYTGGKADLFGRVVFVCLAGIQDWEEQITELRIEPSLN